MTMQNPDKPILAKDLNDYHNKILPYLGGMPEVLANKFARGDLYDTNEKMIGKWIDGKPLYQKTFIGTFSGNTGNENTVETFSGEAVNIDTVVSAEVSCVSDNGNNKDFNGYNRFAVRTYGNDIVVVSIANLGDVSNIKATIRYTKTTDSANSFNIGEATDYSTEEKIVGTWIDGSYIYQKTIKITVPNGTSSTTFASNVDKSYIMNAILNTVNNECIPLPVFGNYTIRMYTQGSLLYLENNHPNWIGSDLYVTIQYTKTT